MSDPTPPFRATRSQAYACLVDAPLENAWIRLSSVVPGWQPSLSSEGADKPIMEYMPAVPGQGLTYSAYQAYVLAEAEAERMAPFAAYDSQTDDWIGGATFTRIDRTHRCLTIDFLWINEGFRTSTYHLAIEALMIERAIKWGAKRLEWHVDVRNIPAGSAIRKIGAVHEGTRRTGRRMANGDWADLDVYSIVGAELKTRLREIQTRLPER